MKESEVNKVISGLIDRVCPEGMSFADTNKLAQEAGLSYETIRKLRERKSLSAQTLIRLLLVHGVKANDLIHIPQNNKSKLGMYRTEWNKLGATISEEEAKEFITFIKYVKEGWQLKK